MIAIRNSEKEFLKSIAHEADDQIIYHEQFGFLTASTWKARQRMRERSGLRAVPSQHAIVIQIQDRKLSTTSQDCQIQSSEDDHRLQLRGQLFHLNFIELDQISGGQSATEALALMPSSWKKIVIPIALLLLLIAVPFLMPSKATDELQDAQKSVEPEPVVVKMETVKTVTPAEEQQVKPQQEVKAPALDPQSKAKKVLTQNLGFLKLVGKKDLSKANGGLPTKLENASAGAGQGGTEGSGGELLTGIGQGLRQTTVGNSGTQGLGGVGTKGPGGGLGGYGETSMSGAGARSLSAIPLAQEAKVEGGLDRAVIQATILRYLSQVRACYEEGLKRKDGLVGQVTMDFEINAQGNLNFANVLKSSLQDAEVESCISGRMKKWKFPLPRGGVNVKVTYPFMLRPIKS
jgi:TonB family protein